MIVCMWWILIFGLWVSFEDLLLGAVPTCDLWRCDFLVTIDGFSESSQIFLRIRQYVRCYQKIVARQIASGCGALVLVFVIDETFMVEGVLGLGEIMFCEIFLDQ